MTLPGGPADKLGNLYEKWWTLSVFVRMLQAGNEDRFVFASSWRSWNGDWTAHEPRS